MKLSLNSVDSGQSRLPCLLRVGFVQSAEGQPLRRTERCPQTAAGEVRSSPVCRPLAARTFRTPHASPGSQRAGGSASLGPEQLLVPRSLSQVSAVSIAVQHSFEGSFWSARRPLSPLSPSGGGVGTRAANGGALAACTGRRQGATSTGQHTVSPHSPGVQDTNGVTTWDCRVRAGWDGSSAEAGENLHAHTHTHMRMCAHTHSLPAADTRPVHRGAQHT